MLRNWKTSYELWYTSKEDKKTSNINSIEVPKKNHLLYLLSIVQKKLDMEANFRNIVADG